MQVTHYDDNGYHFKEIIYDEYNVLVGLSAEYMKRGARVWLVPFKCEGMKWMLTVREAA